jgi:hypothetical protein
LASRILISGKVLARQQALRFLMRSRRRSAGRHAILRYCMACDPDDVGRGAALRLILVQLKDRYIQRLLTTNGVV